jgi:TatD DNase family protein
MPSIASVGPKYYDAHNHLQDDRFGGRQAELVSACRSAGVVRMVVNGSCEEDWPAVLSLARQFAPLVVPSFGYHPWYIRERPADWDKRLGEFLDAGPAGVGEIGLDRWKPNLPYDGQEAVFVRQLRMAAERNVPASIHCLRAWGRMLELLRSHPRPACGFILHSYGGPAEMVEPLAELGAYFSLPGFFAHERKERQRETFKRVPAERLLLETDAPDQLLPDGLQKEVLLEAGTSRALNHPVNIVAVYDFAAQLLARPPEALAGQVETNFWRMWNSSLKPPVAQGAFPRP